MTEPIARRDAGSVAHFEPLALIGAGGFFGVCEMGEAKNYSIKFKGGIDNVRAIMQSLREWKPSSGKHLEVWYKPQMNVHPTVALFSHGKIEAKDITPRSRGTWIVRAGGEIVNGKSAGYTDIARIEAYEKRLNYTEIELVAGPDSLPFGGDLEELFSILKSETESAGDAEDGQPAPLTKDEIARLITATLIRMEIEFERKEVGGTVEFTVYRDDGEAGRLFAIDAERNRLGMSQTKDKYAGWLKEVYDLITRQAQAWKSDAQKPGVAALVKGWETYVETDEQIWRGIQATLSVGGQLSKVQSGQVNHQVQEAIRHSDMRRHKRWTELQAQVEAQVAKPNHLESKILEVCRALKVEGLHPSDELVATRLPLSRKGTSYTREHICRVRNAMRKRGIPEV
ncbi:MAG TPA: hypothetical protein VJL59_21830 [Anaerolineales bacterium]|nr:hypothetical protein [Anaerolineales bacterium]